MAETNLQEFRKRIVAVDRENAGGRWKKSGTFHRIALAWRVIRLPWRLGLKLAGVLIVIKALLLLDLGEAAYRQKLAAYRDPTPGQRLGLAVMQPDRLSLGLSAVLALSEVKLR